jgi:hypothetical protein
MSCDNKNGVELIIHNESDEMIDSVRVWTSDRKATIKLIDIKTGERKSDFLDMTKISKTDGDYILQINSNGTFKNKNMGYYTNGFSSDETIDVYVKNDTITYVQKLR